MKRIFFALILSIAATQTVADANPQLVASVEHRLRAYHLQADVSQFSLTTVARLHFALSENESYLDKRRRLKWILRNATYKN